MARARVMLVDDDASIRRFVSLALEDLDVDLLTCASVAEAVKVLQTGPVQLLLTDLMMPGENGLDLLERLTRDAALRGPARLAVFSAGLNPEMRARLGRFDIWRQLSKPVSVTELEACVRDATEAGDSAAAPAGGMASLRSVHSAAPPHLAATELSPEEHDAARAHFAGDVALFTDFRASCRAQFPADLARGDAAIARGDAPDLRHLAHSLKSVLTLLGHDALSATARELETCAAGADMARAAPLWARLRLGLAGMLPA